MIRRRGLGSRLGASVAILVLCACRTPSGSTAVTPVDRPHEERPGPRPEGEHEREGRGELEARMRKLIEDHRARVSASTRDPRACEDLCSLATSICGVSEKLCHLAEEHPQDDAYQNLCREARQECREAQQSCVNCVEAHRAR